MNLIPYELKRYLGWTTLVLVSLAALSFFLLQTNKYLIKKNNSDPVSLFMRKKLKRIIPFIHHFHYSFGLMAIMTGIIHGYTLLGRIRLHSGYLLWSLILTQGILGATMKYSRNSQVKMKIKLVHRYTMFITLLAMITHVILMN
jgi:hypothetical protein